MSTDIAANPAPVPGFSSLALSPAVQRVLADVGYESPSPIQAATIPQLLAGKDVVGQAQTGTGKTAAFALPILSQLDMPAPARRPWCWHRPASWPFRWPKLSSDMPRT